MAKESRKSAWRILGALLLAAMAIFAVEGGEYGTSDLIKLHARKRDVLARTDSLRVEVDSLERLKRALLSDPALQERIAREEFGMIKDREILYRFAEPDSTH